MKKNEIRLIKQLLLEFDIERVVTTILNYFKSAIKNVERVEFYKKDKTGFKLIAPHNDENSNSELSNNEFNKIENIVQINKNLFFPIKYKNKIIAIILVYLKRNTKIKDLNYFIEIIEFFSAIYYYNKIYEFAIKDPLTGVYNKRYFIYKCNEIMDDYKNNQANGSVALMMIDIDHFKHYNDKYGHQIGDIILIQLSKTILKIVKKYNGLFARYGGEEFLVLIRDIDAKKAVHIANEIRLHIKNMKIYNDEYFWKMTISIGIALFPDNASTLEELISKSDTALYESKNNGRNRVSLYKNI